LQASGAATRRVQLVRTSSAAERHPLSCNPWATDTQASRLRDPPGSSGSHKPSALHPLRAPRDPEPPGARPRAPAGLAAGEHQDWAPFPGKPRANSFGRGRQQLPRLTGALVFTKATVFACFLGHCDCLDSCRTLDT
jgi:hypothetical protein